MTAPVKKEGYKQFAVERLHFVDEKERASSPFALVLINRQDTCYSPHTSAFLSSSNLRPLTPSSPTGDFFPLFSRALSFSSCLDAPHLVAPMHGFEIRTKTGSSTFARELSLMPEAETMHPTSHAEFIKYLGPSVIAKPTDKGLMLLSAYYFQKYGIDITVTSSYETFSEALKAPLYKPKARAWGIIATNGCPIRSHVTPVICFKKDESSPIEILQLDSIETPILAVTETLRAIRSEDPEAPIYEVRGSRQMDSYGCRTDAICVLKDALRLLESEEIDDLKTYLKVITSYGPRHSFYLPGSWAKSAQLVDCIKDPFTTPILSSLETLGSFYEYYTPKPKASISLELPISNFLSFKGKKLIKKIPQILDENNSELRRRFRHLEAFFMGPLPKKGEEE